MNGRASYHPADDVDTDAPPPLAKIDHQPRVTKSGIAGVELTYSKSGCPQSWVARTVVNDTHRSDSFAIATFGDARAKALAIAARQRQFEMQGRQAAPKAQGELRRKAAATMLAASLAR